MKQEIAHIALLVREYNEAIAFYTQKLNFELIEDTRLNETKRWVVIRPKGSGQTGLLLARAADKHQQEFVGNQSGGRVFLFLYTDNFQRDFQNLLDHQIEIHREPVQETWGMVAVFKDLYGNLWDLIQPADPK